MQLSESQCVHPEEPHSRPVSRPRLLCFGWQHCNCANRNAYAPEGPRPRPVLEPRPNCVGQQHYNSTNGNAYHSNGLTPARFGPSTPRLNELQRPQAADGSSAIRRIGRLSALVTGIGAAGPVNAARAGVDDAAQTAAHGGDGRGAPRRTARRRPIGGAAGVVDLLGDGAPVVLGHEGVGLLLRPLLASLFAS